MLHDIVELCRSYPQIALFLALAIGYLIGKIKIRGFSLGSTAGVLITALVLGQMVISVPPLLKTVCFALFIFCMGYKVGPQFFGGLKKEGLHYIWLSLVVAVTGLITAICVGKIFGFDKGITAGLLGGAMTQSAVIGTAEGAIKHLSISAAEKITLEGHVAMAFAITYIFGVAGMILFHKIVPRLLRINLKDEVGKLEQEMSGGSGGVEEGLGLFSWHGSLSLRAYRVTNPAVSGKTVSSLEALFPERATIEKVKRGDKFLDIRPDTAIQTGDIISVIGLHPAFLGADKTIGPEVSDISKVDVLGEVLKVCVLNPEADGKTIGEFSKDKRTHGIFLKRITRQGHEIPITRDTVIHKCDVLQITGAKDDVERVVKLAGYVERPTAATDLVMMGLGIVLGTLMGLLAVKVAGIPITLGVGGGVLISGLVFGWLRSVHPTFGQMPTGAQCLLTDLGLNLFIACVGLVAAPKAVQALQTTGASIFIAGVAVTLMPQIIGMLFGKTVLKLNPILLFGGLTGAETATPALNALKEEAQSAMPTLGFTVPYAFGNVILTIWGTVLIYVM